MGNRYDELDIKALQILMDYSNAHFPLDLYYLCEKLRIKLIPYSSLPKGKLEEINAIATNGELKDGCSIILGHPDENGYLAYTYYNDNIKDVMIEERIWFTIAHEIKHVAYKEIDPTDVEETEANHFARMLLAPTCVLIAGRYDNQKDIINKFKLTDSASKNALNAKNNRVNKYGEAMFDYEVDFIEWFLNNIKK